MPFTPRLCVTVLRKLARTVPLRLVSGQACSLNNRGKDRAALVGVVVAVTLAAAVVVAEALDHEHKEQTTDPASESVIDYKISEN